MVVVTNIGAMPAELPLTPAREAYLALLLAHERLASEFAELFKRHGLTMAQFNVLRILVQGPAQGLACQEVGEQLLNRVPDVTRLFDRMEKAGLVKRERCSQDRRVVRARLTPKGRRTCEGCYGDVAALHERQLAHMKSSEVAALTTGLHRVLERT